MDFLLQFPHHKSNIQQKKAVDTLHTFCCKKLKEYKNYRLCFAYS